MKVSLSGQGGCLFLPQEQQHDPLARAARLIQDSEIEPPSVPHLSTNILETKPRIWQRPVQPRTEAMRPARRSEPVTIGLGEKIFAALLAITGAVIILTGRWATTDDMIGDLIAGLIMVPLGIVVLLMWNFQR